MDFKNLNIEELINTTFACRCGKDHTADIEHIAIGEGVVERLPEFLSDQKIHDGSLLKKGDKVYLVADKNTWDVAGESVKKIVTEAGYPVESYIFPHKHMHAEQQFADEIEEHLPEETKLVIAIGSGTINDLTRFVAFNHDLPYYIVATAPSMDGYASNVSPLVQNNLKITHPAECASAIIGDTDFLATAPDVMVAAGLGDVLGKVLAIGDWRQSNIINDEYYCDNVGDLVLESVRKCIENVPGLVERDPQALTYLMESLVLIGIAMSFIGYSRPASASEHHISHFMEMKSIQNGEYGQLHGTCVGMATALVGEMYDELLKRDIDYEKAREHAKSFDYDRWKAEIERSYGPGAEEVLKLYDKVGQNEPETVLKRIDKFEENEETLKEIIKAEVDQTKKAPELLAQLGGLNSPEQFDFSADEFKDILLYAKELRDRYAALQILYDLGLLDEIAQTVIDRHFKKD